MGGEIDPSRLPWLCFIRKALGHRSRFWPFDGWALPAAGSMITEVYPALWTRRFAREGCIRHQHDAFCIAAWLSQADHDGSLARFSKPDLTPTEAFVARVEDWILGVL